MIPGATFPDPGKLSYRMAKQRLFRRVPHRKRQIRKMGNRPPEKNLTRIFEPGFSGKGEGRGMGLHIARETMRQAGGDLTVESSDAFTAFRGTLPKSIKPVEEEAP